MESGAGVERQMKYVLVTGGVVSGLGKGVTASSIGVVLKSCGLRVTSIKIGFSISSFPDCLLVVHPYLNTDAGTMSPFEHGEVFVLDDGGENCIVCDSGDIESMPFIEALRQLSFSVGNLESIIHLYYHIVYMHLQVANILNIHDVPNIWHIPLLLRVKIAMVGKYTGLTDSYLSVVKVCL
ncbi:hypothetical protein BHM03_00024974 [Ensete ventricosum]|nr:hypothetical protein BHM03_00024974 [Ensete ventricosum]